MQYLFHVLRKNRQEAESYWQDISFETENENETVATALRRINGTGLAKPEIEWECSCLQKKCGACAMVISGLPRLACDTKLTEVKKGKNNQIVLEPLHKFPVVADLVVDRSILFENLKLMKLWTKSPVALTEKTTDQVYDASRCLQCGCCLEICPNFCPGEEFYGAAAFVPTARLLLELPVEERDKIQKLYEQHVFRGCGKSLACRDICPAGIDMDHLLSKSNAIAIWKRR